MIVPFLMEDFLFINVDFRVLTAQNVHCPYFLGMLFGIQEGGKV